MAFFTIRKRKRFLLTSLLVEEQKPKSVCCSGVAVVKWLLLFLNSHCERHNGFWLDIFIMLEVLTTFALMNVQSNKSAQEQQKVGLRQRFFFLYCKEQSGPPTHAMCTL